MSNKSKSDNNVTNLTTNKIKNTIKSKSPSRKKKPKKLSLQSTSDEIDFPLPIRSPRLSLQTPEYIDTFPDPSLDDINNNDILTDAQQIIYSPRFRQTKDVDTVPIMTLEGLRDTTELMAELGRGFYGKKFSDLIDALGLETNENISSSCDNNESIEVTRRNTANGSFGNIFQFSDYNNSRIQKHRQKVLEEIDSKIEDIISKAKQIEIIASCKKLNLLSISSEFFLATISGPNYNEETRSYKKIIAARSISTYPLIGNEKRAGDPIADYYYARIFGSATVLALADGCNWGDRPKEAALSATTSFVRYIQDRLHLLFDTRVAAQTIINGFSVAHDSIIRDHKRNTFNAGTCTLLGGLLVPIFDESSISFLEQSQLNQYNSLYTNYNTAKKERKIKTKSIGNVGDILHLNTQRVKSAKTKKKQKKKLSPRLHNINKTNNNKNNNNDTSENEHITTEINEESSSSLSYNNNYKKKSQKSEPHKTEDSFKLQFQSNSETKAVHIPSNHKIKLSQPLTRPKFTRKRRTSHGIIDSEPSTEQQIQYPIKRKRKKEKFCFIYGNVGDCKAFVYSHKKKIVTDITYSNRESSYNASDCGGRLGPYKKGGLPDMRNFTVSFCTVKPNDLLIIVSDGIHDNLDPQYLGVSPRELHINSDNWDVVEVSVANKAKNLFREKKLCSIIESTSLDPQSICDTLSDYSYNLTNPGRVFMQTNPSLELPPDYLTYPGKMDHTTVLCVKVNSTASDSEVLLRTAFHKKESISNGKHITKKDLERSSFH